LLDVVEALQARGLIFGRAECGQKDRGKNGDDGNYHKQLDQCECRMSDTARSLAWQPRLHGLSLSHPGI